MGLGLIRIEKFPRIRSEWNCLVRIQIPEWFGKFRIGSEWISIRNLRQGGYIAARNRSKRKQRQGPLIGSASEVIVGAPGIWGRERVIHEERDGPKKVAESMSPTHELGGDSHPTTTRFSAPMHLGWPVPNSRIDRSEYPWQSIRAHNRGIHWRTRSTKSEFFSKRYWSQQPTAQIIKGRFRTYSCKKSQDFYL